jgi:hypothetical protein
LKEEREASLLIAMYLFSSREKEATTYQLFQDALDFIIPSSTLGWIAADEGVVGLVG